MPANDQTPEARIQAIRARFETVTEAARMGELDVLNRSHHASWDDVSFLLNHVTSLRQRLTATEGARDKAQLAASRAWAEIDDTLKPQIATLTEELEKAEQAMDDDPARSTPPRLRSGIAARIAMHLLASASTRAAVIERAERAEAALTEAQAQRDRALNETTRLVDEERRRWYRALSWFGEDLEGLAPEVVGERVSAANGMANEAGAKAVIQSIADRASLHTLREALETYGKHHEDCLLERDTDSTACTCGLSAALAPKEMQPSPTPTTEPG